MIWSDVGSSQPKSWLPKFIAPRQMGDTFSPDRPRRRCVMLAKGTLLNLVYGRWSLEVYQRRHGPSAPSCVLTVYHMALLSPGSEGLVAGPRRVRGWPPPSERGFSRSLWRWHCRTVSSDYLRRTPRR